MESLIKLKKHTHKNRAYIKYTDKKIAAYFIGGYFLFKLKEEIKTDSIHPLRIN